MYHKLQLKRGPLCCLEPFYFGPVERCTTAAHSRPTPVHWQLELDLVLSRYFGSHFKQQPAITSIYTDRKEWKKKITTALMEAVSYMDNGHVAFEHHEAKH